jgi:drug/metabolite transporter (DMT)-like permease
VNNVSEARVGFVKFDCPKCGQPLEAEADLAIEGVTCPTCNTGFVPKIGIKTLSQRQHEIWAYSDGRFKDQLNLLAVACLVMGPIIFLGSLAMQKAWAPDISDWNEAVMVGSVSAGIWGLARSVAVYSKWDVAMFLIVSGVAVMLGAWLIFGENVPAILVGGFVMISGIMLKSKKD